MVGFHEGERAVQAEEGVTLAASRLEGMLAGCGIGAGVAAFLAQRTLVVATARDRDGLLWTSPLVGPAGFADVRDPTTLHLAATPDPGDPLHGLDAGQPVGLIAVDYDRRRRFRINGTLVATGTDGLTVAVDEAYGNCPQYIPRRSLARTGDTARHTAPSSFDPGPIGLTDLDRATITTADTFHLGTTHPDRGNDASHRGGAPGFVRVDGDRVWWPDYPGNNMFNSLGNLRTDPEAALLFLDFTTGTALHVHGSAVVDHLEPGSPGDDAHTGRRVVLTVDDVRHSPLALASGLAEPSPWNPALREST